MTACRKNLLFVSVATVGLALPLFWSGEAFAQDGASAGPEASNDADIIVTARKRAERLDDVPISVSVLSGNRLQAEGVTQIAQAVQAAPGVSVTPTPVGDLLFIRGIGSGENQGFEMSVGTFVDGVYFGRGRSARNAFLDVDRIEVLKGPQPIQFGKNTIGGAFNITTRKPTANAEAYIEEYWEPQFNTFQTTGVVSGPLSDTLDARLVARSNISDGFIQNDFTGLDETRRRDWAGRGTLVWAPAESLKVTLKGEYGRNSLKGGFAQITKASPLLRSLIATVDTGAEFDLNYHKSGPGTKAPFNKEFDRGDAYNGTLEVNWDIADHTLTSVTSYVGYKTKYSFDSDFTPLNFIQQTWDQKWSNWAQEVRLNSPSGKAFEYTAGLYLSSEDLRNHKVFSFDFAQTPLAALGKADRVQDFKQRTRDWSVFAEGTWHATDRLSLVGGLRYTADKKTADKGLYWADLGSSVPNPTIVRFGPLGLGIAHQYNGLERKTSNTSIAVTGQYKVDGTMYYVSYKQGFKAGGFDEGNASGILRDIFFQDESADSFEAGVKGRAMGGRLQARAAIFYSKYDNLQVSIFDGAAALIVGNAAKSSTRGLELDGQFAVTDRFSLTASGTYLDAHYESYKRGPCSFGKGAICDLSGKTLPYSPKWSGTLGARWEGDVAGGWRYILRSDAFYSSSFFTAGDLDPFVAQRAFAKVDASITLISSDETWNISLIGKNLTNKVTSHFGDDIPLSNLLGNNYQQYVDPPRTVALQVRFKFM